MLRGVLVLLLFFAGGEALSRGLGLPVPGSVLGMVLLALALRRGLVEAEPVRAPARLLLSNLGFFFVPAGVGVVQYLGLLRQYALPIVVASAGSAVLVLALVALVQQRLERP